MDEFHGLMVSNFEEKLAVPYSEASEELKECIQRKYCNQTQVIYRNTRTIQLIYNHALSYVRDHNYSIGGLAAILDLELIVQTVESRFNVAKTKVLCRLVDHVRMGLERMQGQMTTTEFTDLCLKTVRKYVPNSMQELTDLIDALPDEPIEEKEEKKSSLTLEVARQALEERKELYRKELEQVESELQDVLSEFERMQGEINSVKATSRRVLNHSTKEKYRRKLAELNRQLSPISEKKAQLEGRYHFLRKNLA